MKINEAVARVKNGPSDSELHLRAQNQRLTKQLKAFHKDRGKYVEMIEDLKTAVVACPPFPRRELAEHNPTNAVMGAVLKVSDWQIGEVINPRETEGFGKFNYAIARRRVFQLTEKVIDWVKMHRKSGFDIPDLHIFSEADLVSGNIHYELEVTNEFPVTDAAAKAGLLFGEMVAQFAPHFTKVHLWEMNADNHGRLTRKSQAKQGAINNYSYLAHIIGNQYLHAHDNIEIHMSEGVKLLANVVGKKFLISHGHEVMGVMGIPYYGMERSRAREAVKRTHTNKGFDYMSIGHWHVPAIIGRNILVNGSLPGTTEYDHMAGRHCAPAQVSFMVHPKYGLFNWTAWTLD